MTNTQTAAGAPVKTDVQTLRDAAGLMRERAQKATTGPWYEDNIDGVYAYGEPDGDCPTVFRTVSGSYADVQHAAAIASPLVALAVADWLFGVAMALEMDDKSPAYPVTAEVNNALSVARAYLGAETPA